MPGLCATVRENAARIAADARHVRIDESRIAAIDPGPPPALDPDHHYLDGPPEDVARYLLTLDTINFGSGWFPTLRKRPGSSGYLTVAAALADEFRENGPLELNGLDGARVAAILGQQPDHELMGLYGVALNELGAWLGGRAVLDVVPAAAEGLAEALAELPTWRDPGFWKRAQIAASDLALAGLAEFPDLDRLTIFADNLVPHVLRVDGVLVYDDALAAHIDSGELLPPGREETEIRGCAVQACTLIARELGVSERNLDNALWNRGQEPRYKILPRHRTRTTAY
jgi:hypothetical protein